MIDDTDRSDDEKSTRAHIRFDPTDLPDTTFVLTVLEGPDRGLQLELDGAHPAPILVGQSSACGFRLGDRSASRRHAALDVPGDHLRIVDLKSTNGTCVNGVRIVEALLVGGEIVQIGESTIGVLRGRPNDEVTLSTATAFGRLLGMSTEMRRLYPLCERLAASDIPVIIEGETGTGKELLAEALHEQSRRAEGPFVIFDCTTAPPNLIESELFGHRRGAFTGATESRLGLFQAAEGGTIFIDEIGDLDIALQAKLLRAIERREVRPIGSNEMVRIDARVLAATRRDLDREIQAGRFRDDLFHRLAVGRIELPPLRRRRGDIPLLATHFARELGLEHGALPPEIIARWEDQPWPGNVRELANAVARYAALGTFATSGAAPLSSDADVLERVLAADLPYTDARDRVLQEFSKRYLARALDTHRGNVTRAAEASGIGRRYFQMLRSRSEG